jgi:hypothetical protein
MTLDTLIQNADPIIQNAASLTARAVADFKAGKISESEYAELMKNILDFQAVVLLTDDMNRQNEIASAFYALKDIAVALVGL